MVIKFQFVPDFISNGWVRAAFPTNMTEIFSDPLMLQAARNVFFVLFLLYPDGALPFNKSV